MAILKGIDVSSWQEKVNWDKAKDEIDFAIVRLGFGQKSLDKQAKRNISELNRLGIHYGVYWFSYAYTVEMAQNEAKSVIAYLKEVGANLSYPVYFDWEYDSRKTAAGKGVNVSNTLLRNMAVAFCEEIRAAGYYPGIYANPDYINSYFGEEIFKKYDLWLAHYTDKTSREVNLWQYSSKGRVAGIDGNVDMNKCMVDYPAIISPKAEEPKKEETKEETKEESIVNVELTVLKKGSKGDQVKAVQRMLYALGYNLGKKPVDGDFGEKTDSAVRAYQKLHDLTVDGIVGEKTWNTLLKG